MQICNNILHFYNISRDHYHISLSGAISRLAGALSPEPRTHTLYFPASFLPLFLSLFQASSRLGTQEVVSAGRELAQKRIFWVLLMDSWLAVLVIVDIQMNFLSTKFCGRPYLWQTVVMPSFFFFPRFSVPRKPCLDLFWSTFAPVYDKDECLYG